MGYEPIGVEEVVKMVSVLEYDPTPDVTLNMHVAPAGSPSESGQSTMVMVKVTVAFEITSMVFDPEPPWATVILPELVRVKIRVN